jgi:hypothetical protein
MVNVDVEVQENYSWEKYLDIAKHVIHSVNTLLNKVDVPALLCLEQCPDGRPISRLNSYNASSQTQISESFDRNDP